MMSGDRCKRRRRAGLGCAAVLAALLAAGPVLAEGCGGLAGEYLFDVTNAELSTALKQRLGDVFTRFDDRYQTQVPFEPTDDGYVYAAACMAHSCTVDEAFLGIDEATCDVFVGLLENGEYTLVVPASWPPSLDDARRAWMSR
jgi:hypothetical protein